MKVITKRNGLPLYACVSKNASKEEECFRMMQKKKDNHMHNVQILISNEEMVKKRTRKPVCAMTTPIQCFMGERRKGKRKEMQAFSYIDSFRWSKYDPPPEKKSTRKRKI